MLDSPAWADVYTRNGALLVEGEFVQRLNYGQTLETIAEEGAQAFYRGDIAKKSIKTIQSFGGVMELDDVG
jgi:gamma-glutamyltranspeptidase/glutathione hydrolase/leukotriene-C4 hydrolase